MKRLAASRALGSVPRSLVLIVTFVDGARRPKYFLTASNISIAHRRRRCRSAIVALP